MRFITTILYIAVVLNNTLAQFKPDSSKTILTLTEFLNLVKQNYPAAKQADLFYQAAEAELLAAKGGFDSKLYGEYEQKYFDSKNYFSFGESSFFFSIVRKTSILKRN